MEVLTRECQARSGRRAFGARGCTVCPMAVPAWFLNAQVELSSSEGQLSARDGTHTVVVGPAPPGDLDPAWVMAKAAEYWARVELQAAGLSTELPADFGTSYWASPSETLEALAVLTGGGYELVGRIAAHLTDLRQAALGLDEVAAALSMKA